ncbi:Rpp14/Pop5 family protein [Candidatus Marsarchaeota archaeon]|nr:Rpp14/Pop5 family protein [Candidatus Marsarchaeota archaeon]MCL5099610.1 Rpp14/Pop5 family protein [Candidatus Marsarchaeota archaeon]
MMREKRRYVLVETSTPVRGDQDEFKKRLYISLMDCAGQLGYHRINPHVIGFVGSDMFILRASLEGTPSMVAALAMVKSVAGSEMAFYTLKSSGTLRALRDYAKTLGRESAPGTAARQ